MAYNKVTYKDEILMDITDSTVTPETLSEGVVAYGANGERIIGTATGGGSVSAPLIVHSVAEDGALGAPRTTYKSVTIGEGITSIGSGAFAEFHALTGVYIPKSVESVGYYAFRDCRSLTEITYEGTVAEWTAMDTAGIVDYDKVVTVHCSDGDTTASQDSGD